MCRQDECFADLTAVPDALSTAAALRSQIQATTGVTASIGLGANRMLARLATRRAKPNGLVCMSLDEGRKMLRQEAVSSLPGVGRSTVAKLEAIGVTTCAQLLEADRGRLQATLGPKIVRRPLSAEGPPDPATQS